jgi:hypothetical protein
MNYLIYINNTEQIVVWYIQRTKTGYTDIKESRAKISKTKIEAPPAAAEFSGPNCEMICCLVWSVTFMQEMIKDKAKSIN